MDRLDILLESPDLPADRLRVHRLVYREAISRLSDLELTFVDLDPEGLDPDAALGAEVAVVLVQDGMEIRRIHGVIVDLLDPLDTESEHPSYVARVAPRAHRLSLVETQQTYMHLTVPQIIQQKLAAVGLAADTALRLVGSYPEEEFKVQYQESDLAFVSRLAEHLGVSFYFEHTGGRDVIVFTDHAAGFAQVEGAEQLAFRPRGEKSGVYRLERRRTAVPALHAVRDYNYRTPLVDLTASREVARGFAGGVVEQGPHYKTPAEGEMIAQARAEEHAARALVYQGESALPRLTAGARVTIEGHPRLGAVPLLLVEVEHRVEQAAIASGTSIDALHYRNRFHAVPAEPTYRPPRVTPRPRIHGLVTGVVDPGPGGDPGYAQIDEQGRYHVQLLFDTTAPEGRPVSRPIRMAQPHAGAGYGMHLPLKPGTEVVIGFIDGDPDRPIIVGSVPNPVTPSPVDRASARSHRIRTQTGILFDLVDGS